MYLALKEMNIRLPDLSVAAILPGQEVPGFADFATWTQKAMLDQLMVKWAPDGKLSPHEEAKANKRVIQHLPSGPLGPPQRDPEKVLETALYTPAEPKRHNSSLVVDSEAPVLTGEPEPVQALAEPQAAEETLFKAAPAARMNPSVSVTTDLPAASKGAHDCHVCGKQGFKNFAGLRIHMAQRHKDLE